MVANDLSVGDMARRAGVPVSTLHYYEAEGLIRSWRNAGNHRRFDRRELRRVAIIRAAQAVGVPLAEIREVLDHLPRDRAVKASDWAEAARPWAARLEAQIDTLQRLLSQVDSCIGCGCLSLEDCPLYNSEDRMGRAGPGARRWVGASDEKSQL